VERLVLSYCLRNRRNLRTHFRNLRVHPSPSLNRNLSAGPPPHHIADQQQRGYPEKLQAESGPNPGAVDLAQINQHRNIADVLERHGGEQLLGGAREERNRQQEAREKLQQEVLAAQQSQDR